MPTPIVDRLRDSSLRTLAGPIAFGVAAVVTITLGFFALGDTGDDGQPEQFADISTLATLGGTHQSEPDELIEPAPTAQFSTPTPAPTATPTPTPTPTQTPAPTATPVPAAPTSTPAPAAPTATTAPAPPATATPQQAAAEPPAAQPPAAAPQGDTAPQDDAAQEQPPAPAPTATTAPAPEPTAEPQPTPTTPPAPAPTATTAPVTNPPSSGGNAALEQQMLTRVNQVRASVGAPPLTMVSSLTEASRIWAQKMAGGVGLVHCGGCGQAPLPSSCMGWGENIGMGPSMETIQEALEQSPGHYKNMTNPSYTQAGIGIATDSSGLMWITQTFGEGC